MRFPGYLVSDLRVADLGFALSVLAAMRSLFWSDLNRSEAGSIQLWAEPSCLKDVSYKSTLPRGSQSKFSPSLTHVSDMMMINCLDMTAPSPSVMNYVVQGMARDSPLLVCNPECWQYS